MCSHANTARPYMLSAAVRPKEKLRPSDHRRRPFIRAARSPAQPSSRSQYLRGCGCVRTHGRERKRGEEAARAERYAVRDQKRALLRAPLEIMISFFLVCTRTNRITFCKTIRAADASGVRTPMIRHARVGCAAARVRLAAGSRVCRASGQSRSRKWAHAHRGVEITHGGRGPRGERRKVLR